MAIQLQEFAQQVLFGTSMEAKLSFPRETIIDTRPGAAIRTPRTLARPQHLALRADGVRAKYPSEVKLVDERERGRLLHFFANHELLATELMALVLLKFPDAPASFRRGVLETLKEEQIHTQLYMHRMQQCGVTFGELPVSDYFWKSVSSMEDPLDYVTRLSLTFEQANLDYSREYAKIFSQVGDGATAHILDKIYHDEIEHVGFGLKWFRRWKAAGKTDWEAFRERLVFPLSPARAKGNDFNEAGRAAAGLEPGFINDLQLFQQSRGRTPAVLWFNPDAEAFAARNCSEQLAVPASTLQSDLAYLPAYVSRQDDLILLPQAPSADFLRQLQHAGFHLPERCIVDTDAVAAPRIERKLGELRPWAWAPDSVAFFSNNLDACSRPRTAQQLWNAQLRDLYSKLWSTAWAAELAAASKQTDWLAPPEVYGQAVDRMDALIELRAQFAARGYHNIVCKAPFGTAAHGNRCLRDGEAISPALVQWLQNVWDTQGAVLVEPWLERVYDFSVQCEQHDGALKVLAFTQLLNNPRGQFKGILCNGFCKGVPAEVVRFLMQRIDGRPRVYHWYETTVAPRLAAALHARAFHGPLGIDAFLYRDGAGSLRLKSVVEINPRYTLGRVGHELGHHTAAGSVGCLQILTRSQLRKTQAANFIDYCAALTQAHPVRLNTAPKPRLCAGSLPLTDPRTATQFLALYHVRDRVAELPL
jgi:uncharacterized ferritin-like protein (DUF455 family)